jgi:hypothetical protein
MKSYTDYLKEFRDEGIPYRQAQTKAKEAVLKEKSDLEAKENADKEKSDLNAQVKEAEKKAEKSKADADEKLKEDDEPLTYVEILDKVTEENKGKSENLCAKFATKLFQMQAVEEIGTFVMPEIKVKEASMLTDELIQRVDGDIRNNYIDRPAHLKKILKNHFDKNDYTIENTGEANGNHILVIVKIGDIQLPLDGTKYRIQKQLIDQIYE